MSKRLLMTPTEFEEHVCEWVYRNLQVNRPQLVELTHLGVLQGIGGASKIDVLLRITILEGAVITILCECKHQKRPVERDEIQVLVSKIQDTGANKGIVFSTSGFQAGALKYAEVHGVAAIEVSFGGRNGRRKKATMTYLVRFQRRTRGFPWFFPDVRRKRGRARSDE